MEMKSPTWLDASYVQKILRDAEKDESIEVSGITVEAATAEGDNYGSDMYRVGVKFSQVQDGHLIQQTKSLIVKVAPVGGRREEMMVASGLFEKELPMMSVTLPQMREILENVCSTSLSARCFYVQYEKPAHLVIEDLAPRGFRMADREAGMDFDHCLLVLRNLGIFHAASIKLNEQDPNSFAKYTNGIFDEDQPMMRQFFNSGGKALSNEAPKWPELSPRIAEKLVKLSNVLFDKGCDAARYRKDDFNVLNHGDLWINNMMFRYDEEQKPIDHIFVDFQTSNYGSPAVDILHFIGTSTTHEVRIQHRETLLQEYYASLSSTMEKLKCNTEVLSFDKLQESLKNRAFCEVITTIKMLPLVIIEKDKAGDSEEMVKDPEEYSRGFYRGEFCRKIMTELLPRFDSAGLLDV